MTNKRFNIRVYGICEYQKSFLVTDEIVKGVRMTKFVGGGLEWGEGISDALAREFIEECDAEIINFSHFYTTEHFQRSAFNSSDQLISVYYSIELKEPEKINTVEIPFEGVGNNQQCFRWIKIEDLNSELFTFPIDKLVVNRLLDERN